MATLQEIIDKSLKSNYDSSLSSPYSAAPGASVTTQGGMQSGYVAPMTVTRPPVATVGVTTPAPAITTPAPVAEPKVKDIIKFNAPEFDTYGDPSILAYYKEQAQAPKTEAQLYREKIKQFQGEIDATNKIYDQMVREERIAGEGRLGSSAAMSARGGLLGSDFAAAQTDKVTTANRQILGGIEAERQAKIGAILGTVRKTVADELAAKNAARKQGVDSHLEYLKNERENKNKNIKKVTTAFISQGVDPSELPEDEIAKIAFDLQTTKENIFDAYSTAKAEAEANKPKLLSVSEGASLVDPITGKVIYKNPKTYAPGTGSSSVALTPDNKRTLLGGGWSEADISSLESDVRQYGLTQVIENAKANGADTSQITALKSAYKTSDAGDDETNLTRENIASFFGISDDDTQSSFLGFEYGATGKEQLDTLEETINRYRAVGYTDKEILKMME